MVSSLEHPHCLSHGHKTDKSRLLLRQFALDNLRRLRGLDRVILRQIANDDIGVEANHPRRERRIRLAAPSMGAFSISSSEALPCLDCRMPLSLERGIFGRITTLPSGWIKNLTRSPGARWR